jgi:hypothetical protein
MALTPEQLRLMSAEGSGPPLTLEQSEQMRRMYPANDSDYAIRLHERSQPNTTMMGFFNDGQPDNLDQMYNTGQNTVPSSTRGPLNPFDSMPNNINPGDLVGGPAPQEPGQEFNTTDIFGAGNNPIMNNPIAPMPSPLTPPSGMNNNQDYSGLLKGIGNLFEQYFPNQGQNTQSRLGQSNLSNNFGQASSFNGPGILGLITPQRG